MSLTKKLNSACPCTNPWGHHLSLVSDWTMSRSPQPFKFLIHWVVHLSKPSLQETSHRAQCQTLYICAGRWCHSLFRHPPPLQPHHRQSPNLSLVKLSWLSPIMSLPSMFLSIISRRFCSVILSGIEVRLTSLSSQFPFPKIYGCSVSPFPVCGNCHGELPELLKYSG